MKIGDGNRNDRLTDLDCHQLRIMHIANVHLRVAGHQWDEITTGIITIVCGWERQGVDVLAGEKFRLHVVFKHKGHEGHKG